MERMDLYRLQRCTLSRGDRAFRARTGGTEGISHYSLAVAVTEVTPIETNPSYHPNIAGLGNMQPSLFGLCSCGDSAGERAPQQ